MKKTCTRYAFPLLSSCVHAAAAAKPAFRPPSRPPRSTRTRIPAPRSPRGRNTSQTSITKNPGAMGDNDGPAVVIYWSKAITRPRWRSPLSQIDIHNIRSDGRVVAGYIFLGLTVYAPWGWMNSVDAGLVWSGRVGGWRLFYSSYDPKVWWHSTDVFLDPTSDYKIVLDSSEGDGQVKLSVYDMDGGLADSADIVLNNALADGSNTAFFYELRHRLGDRPAIRPQRQSHRRLGGDHPLQHRRQHLYAEHSHLNAALYNGGEKVFWNEGEHRPPVHLAEQKARESGL